METFQCNNLNHVNEQILGFCLNEHCKQPNQFCYQCLTMTHSDHQKDCIRFVTMSQDIQKFILAQNQSSIEMKKIIDQMKNLLDQIYKKTEQEITTLENMDQQLINQEYLNFKSQINIIKQFYSKQKENETQQQIIELNKIINTIKNIVTVQTQVNVQINSKVNSGFSKIIKIVEITEDNEVYKQQYTYKAKSLFIEGEELTKSSEFQQALIKFDDSIKLFSKDVDVYLWKGFALNSLNRYEEAIVCCDNAIQINSINDMAWNNKGYALNSLSRYQEAIECCDKAISINPNNHFALINKGFALHQNNNYSSAIVCYDLALSICADPQLLELKADSEKKQKSQKIYLL